MAGTFGLWRSGWQTYMVETTGMTWSEVISEIERYMGLTGQACAYDVGIHNIPDLRVRGRTGLGSMFDRWESREPVLGSSAVPLTILDQLVDERIVGQQRPR